MSRTIGSDLQQYYRLHAPIYDLTRPFFLFGRARLVAGLTRRFGDEGRSPPRILEVGCGTGRNLAALRKAFPLSRIVGIDMSAAMLERAQRRLRGTVKLIHGKLGATDAGASYDIVIASYMLSMTGSEQASCIAAMRAALAPGGWLGVVDFQRTRFPGFASWMARNHVLFDAQLPDRLAHADADPRSENPLSSFPAYGGWWHYFVWIGH